MLDLCVESMSSENMPLNKHSIKQLFGPHLGIEASELCRECEKAWGCGAGRGLASGVWLTSAICNEHEVLIDMTDQLLKKVNYLRTN